MRTFMKQSTGQQITAKLSTGILLLTLAAGSALAQIPAVIQHVQDKMNGVQQQNKAASDAALSGNVKAPAGKPSAASAAKPASTPVAAKPVTAPATSAAAPAPAKPAVAKDVPAPQASKPVTSAKTPTAAVPMAKSAASVVKPAAPVAKAATPAAKTAAPVAKAAAPVAKKDPFAKSAAPSATAKPVEKAATDATKKTGTVSTEANAVDAKPDSKEEAAEKKKESGFITAGNRRDPFVSPIVQHMGGSGCSTGKRCLAIDQIALRGIVKSDAGMIAVVVNSLDKAYFLRENDPVFNGYVLKISGDSVVFKETVQDKLGHLSTREVVKKITTPAV